MYQCVCCCCKVYAIVLVQLHTSMLMARRLMIDVLWSMWNVVELSKGGNLADLVRVKIRDYVSMLNSCVEWNFLKNFIHKWILVHFIEGLIGRFTICYVALLLGAHLTLQLDPKYFKYILGRTL